MARRISISQYAEFALLIGGLSMLAYASITYLSGRASARAAVERFHAAAQSQERAEHTPLKTVTQVDYSLWSAKRTEQYKASLAEHFDEPVALLKVAKIHLEVPVFEGTDDRVLNRGVGRIEGSARVDESGNVAIAGHRDGFFRGLKDVRVGDSIELETVDATQTYVTDWIRVVDPHDVSVLQSGPVPAVTLVTCFPFYVLGSAPHRYIVHASLHGKTER